MIGSPLGRIYGGALFELAREKGILPKVTEELDSFVASYGAEPQLQHFLGSPNVLLESKLSLLEKTVGAKASPVLAHFLAVLVKKGRIDALREIHVAFRALVDESHGIVRGRAKVAVPLEDGLVKRVEEILSKQLDRKVGLEVVTDPAILGGLVVQVEDRLIDASVRTQLDRLRDRLLAQKL